MKKDNYSIEYMIKNMWTSSEEEFLEKLGSFDIFERDKCGNDIVHILLKTKEIKMDLKNIMEKLLKMGLDINTKQKTGPFQRSYLHLALCVDNKSIFDYLLKKGADVNSTDAHGNNILSSAIFKYKSNSDNYGYYINVLLENGADITHKNNYGVSPKELANMIANSDVKKYFIVH